MAKKVTDPTDPTKKTRSRALRQREKFQVLRSVATATAANAADLPASEVPRKSLEGVLTEIDKILEEQADFRANKQMSTQRLQTLLNQGGKLATVLRTIAKQHYGHGNDKLVQFGVQPLRSRPKPTVEPPTPPAEGGPTPPTSTTPSTSK